MPIFGAADNLVYLAWTETKSLYKIEDPSQLIVGDSDILFVASRDNGKTFESPLNLSGRIGAFTPEPEIVLSEGRIDVTWRDIVPQIKNVFLNFYGNAEVIRTRSLDGGETFETPSNLSINPAGSH